MYIAIVTVFPRDNNHIDGGVAGVSKYIVDELIKIPDVKLTVVVPKGAAGETICEQWQNFNVYRVGKKGFWNFLPGTLYDIFAGKRQIKSLLRQINPDIVHFQNDAYLAANCPYPNILTIHGIAECDAVWDHRWGLLRWAKHLLLKTTEQYGRRRAKHVILISEYVRKFLPQNNLLKTWLINNPIADSFFDVNWQFEPGRIFCCSRVRPLKNTIGMIKAFAKICRRFPNAQLRIAGAAEPVYLRDCRREAKIHNVSDNVHFLGNLSIKEVQVELSHANCFAIPSFQENAPLSIAEAMAVGVPVVGARVGGIPEMVEDSKTGLLINPYNIDSIAEAVLKILTNRNLAVSMSSRAKEIAKHSYMASAVCEKTLKAYNEILPGKKLLTLNRALVNTKDKLICASNKS
jgi:glycosyltransferase involved in cell wall biosynthesis